MSSHFNPNLKIPLQPRLTLHAIAPTQENGNRELKTAPQEIVEQEVSLRIICRVICKLLKGTLKFLDFVERFTKHPDMPKNRTLIYYDQGESRWKHRWENDFPGKAFWGPKEVGKCPRGLSLSRIVRQLRAGIPEKGTVSPKRIYNVIEGVPYAAESNNFQNRYHGYPMVVKRRLPREIIEELRSRAVKTGFKRVFENWVARYGLW